VTVTAHLGAGVHHVLCGVLVGGVGPVVAVVAEAIRDQQSPRRDQAAQYGRHHNQKRHQLLGYSRHVSLLLSPRIESEDFGAIIIEPVGQVNAFYLLYSRDIDAILGGKGTLAAAPTIGQPFLSNAAVDKTLRMPELQPDNGLTNDDLFCRDLPTNPLPQMGKILVTGATGYIGGRLAPELLVRGYQVRVMVRSDLRGHADMWPEAEVAVADAFNPEELNRALRGIHTAFYLIHSLILGPHEFEAADIKAAENFRRAAEEQQLKRIIYLGGLGDARVPLSSHLRNRMEVAMELRKGRTPVTILRAAVIIGSGSASYEIMNHLVRRMPVIVLPRWAKNRCQPVAIRDVVKYLVGALEVSPTTGESFDIGGPEILTYREMLATLAAITRRKTLVISAPVSFISLFAYIVSLLTPVPNAIVRCLMEGLKNEVVCQDESIKKYLPFEPISFRQAVLRAMTREDQDRVSTRWSDAYPPAGELAIKLDELDGEIVRKTSQSLQTSTSAEALFRSICMIGGERGWYTGTWLWILRGWLDRLFLGVGVSRGRKSRVHLEIHDVIDFWRIEDLQENRRLLLRAEMRMPGRAWLEFKIDPIEPTDRRLLSVTAYFDTYTRLGRLYWYLLLPIHFFIFRNLIRQIEKRG